MEKDTLIIVMIILFCAAIFFACLGVVKIAAAKTSLKNLYNYKGGDGYNVKRNWEKINWAIAILVVSTATIAVIMFFLISRA